MPQPFRLSAKAQRTTEQPISFLMAAAVENPDLISFAAGLVDPRELPVEATLQQAQAILGDAGRGAVAMQYGTTPGLAQLRQRLVERACALDGTTPAALSLTADNVVVTTGSQQALYLIGDVMLDPGDLVLAASPTYFVMTGTFQSLGAEVRPVPMDDGGFDVDALAEIVDALTGDELARLKVVYVQTYHQNPTGRTLAAERRRPLLDVIERASDRAGRRVLLLEDAAYRELNYTATPPPTVKSLDIDNVFVAQCQTFSKPFAPGLKLGYALLPDDLVDPVLQQKGNHDFGGANLTQHLALAALDSGDYDRQVAHLCDRYGQKMRAVLDALDTHLGDVDGVSWTEPTGGLYVWVTLPEHLDAGREGELFGDCVRTGTMYVPGAYAHPGGDVARNELRLSFGHVNPALIDEGIRRLADCVRKQLVPVAV